MTQETNQRIKLGIFVTTGVLLLVAGLYLLGNKKNMFSKSISIYTHFENIYGLRPGNNIRLSGIDIGTVKEIQILSSTNVYIEMSIEEKVKEFITLNSVATLGTDGLMGNRIVNIVPMPGNARTIEDGDQIKSKELIGTDEMMETLDKTNKNIAIISEDLVKITGGIEKSRGTLYSVLKDTSLAEKINYSLDNISDVSKSLNTFSADLVFLSQNIKYGKGVLGELTLDSSSAHLALSESLKNILEASKQLSGFSNSLKETMDSIKGSKGTVSTILYDTTMARQLQSSMANVDTSAARFNELMKALRGNFLFRKYFRKQESEK